MFSVKLNKLRIDERGGKRNKNREFSLEKKNSLKVVKEFSVFFLFIWIFINSHRPKRI